MKLSDEIALGRIGLTVRDLSVSRRFYEEGLGLLPLEDEAGKVVLGAGGHALVELVERPGARRRPQAAGLFHLALLVPGRAALGRILGHLRHADIPLDGASDHGVSEALYLADPDGHGIEIYRDRPREDWYAQGRFRMVTERLDLEDLLEAAAGTTFTGMEAGTVLGHVHLEAQDLAASTAFYEDELGFARMTEYPGAVFLSKGGYHHHVALNAWRRRSIPQSTDADSVDLRFYEILGTGLAEPVTLRDPAGLEVRLLP